MTCQLEDWQVKSTQAMTSILKADLVEGKGREVAEALAILMKPLAGGFWFLGKPRYHLRKVVPAVGQLTIYFSIKMPFPPW